jgi:hypothetical protein
MALSVQDLTTPVTRQQVQASIYNVLASVGVDTTAWSSGSVVRTMIVGVSVVLAAFSQLMALLARAGFLALSSGDWLTLVAKYVYNVERIEASFASGVLYVSNSSGASYGLDPGDLIVANANGFTFRNLAAIVVGPGASNIVVDIAATEAGSASTSNPGSITRVVSSLNGVTCTNPASLVGLDAEGDTALRARASESLGALSPMGPWDAYTAAIHNAKRADGSSLGVTRIRLKADGYGRLYVYMATAAGAVPGSDVIIADTAVQRWAAPQAITAIVNSATAYLIPVTYTVWMYNTSGLTEQQIKDTIASALTAFMETQPIAGNVIGADPGRVFTDAIRAAISNARPEIFHVEVTAPGTPYVEPGLTGVPMLGTVTPTAINQVPPPEGYST